jgi:hypothetical protein
MAELLAVRAATAESGGPAVIPPIAVRMAYEVRNLVERASV